MKAIIKGMITPLYATPSKSAELIDEVLYGMIVTVIEKVDKDWFYIETPYAYKGYCHGDNLCFEEERLNSWLNDAHHVVNQGFADILTQPKIQSSILATLVRGSTIQFVEKLKAEAQWVKVRLVTGEIGYTRGQWLKAKVNEQLLNEEEFRDKVVETALSYLTTPYRWGGKTPLGIDCSGLCSMAYYLNGVVIYRDARIVEEFPIKEIPYEEIKKGDLIYFPGHVAMYMGNDFYIHSSIGGNEVNINSLNKNHHHYREDLAISITAVGSLFK